jgi:hypothetical protein
MKRRFAVQILGALLAVVAATLAVSGLAGGTVFGPPVKVTPPLAGGYEPGLVIDGWGNIFATAHKENAQLLLSPDPDSPTYTRSMSWDWISTDGGNTFTDLPGLTAASLEQHEFGDEGDMALDDVGRLYFVDTNVTDDTITRWSVTGLGKVTLDLTRLLIPAAQLVDDRPWVVAHGNGHVFYFGNEGDKVTYPLGMGQGGGFGPGRYTMYASYDGAQTFNAFGYTLKDSGWCRPAADHAAGSPYVYAFCTNDGGSDDVITDVNALGTLWSFVSRDDGATFERYQAGTYKALDTTTSWPSLYVSADGSLWALYVDATALDANGNPLGNKLMLYHSTDHGQTWKAQDVTPKAGFYHYAWVNVSNDGRKLGLACYYRAAKTDPWKVYGAVFRPGQVPSLVSLDDFNPVAPAASSSPPGDFLECAFGPDGRLHVVWTRTEIRVATPVASASVFRDIYTAASQ